MSPGASIVEWLDPAAMRFADRVAAEDTLGHTLTYGELSTLSRRVAAALGAAGIRVGDRVALLMRKSLDTLVVYQAVLRSGAAYVPLDATIPIDRAGELIGDCEARAVFVDEDRADELRAALERRGVTTRVVVLPHREGELRIPSLAEGHEPIPASPPLSAESLAFLLYTSGSTGRPKAVMITHGNVTSFVDWCSEELDLVERDKIGVHSPLHYSLPVFNIYVGWKHGASVVIIDERTARSPELVARSIETHQITAWFSTPTILGLLADTAGAADLRSLRLVMFAGEAFPPSKLNRVRAVLRHPRFIHVLGSTETHIISCYEIGEHVADEHATLPIGPVASRFSARIVDDDLNDVSAGSDGELCLHGAGVTPGYWRVAESESPSFFRDVKGDRWYRTGDVVRVEPDGTLLHRGRRDRMVKKYGHRVELAEIEACLHRSDAVKEAAVIAVPDPESGVRIKAFVVPRAARPTVIALKAHVAQSLPPFMVPDVITLCEQLPRGSTGKVDFAALRDLG